MSRLIFVLLIPAGGWLGGFSVGSRWLQWLLVLARRRVDSRCSWCLSPLLARRRVVSRLFFAPWTRREIGFAGLGKRHRSQTRVNRGLSRQWPPVPCSVPDGPTRVSLSSRWQSRFLQLLTLQTLFTMPLLRTSSPLITLARRPASEMWHFFSWSKVHGSVQALRSFISLCHRTLHFLSLSNLLFSKLSFSNLSFSKLSSPCRYYTLIRRLSGNRQSGRKDFLYIYILFLYLSRIYNISIFFLFNKKSWESVCNL